VSATFTEATVVHSLTPAMCPGCGRLKHAFLRLARGGMCCIPCFEMPLPFASAIALEHPTRNLTITTFRHGKPVVCTGCEKERSTFSRMSGLCIRCTNPLEVR
jgi:hypothetical protein